MAQKNLVVRDSAARLRTNEPSILTVSTASDWRWRSEVKPAPKSSSAMRQPSSRSLLTKPADSSMSCSAAVSVISTTIRCAISRLSLSIAVAAAQPRAVGRGEARDVEAEADLGIRPDFLDRLLEHIAVDEADEAELLDRGDEFAGGDDAPVLVDHAQQAFVIVDRARRTVDHGLIGEGQAAFAQRPLHALAQRHADAMALALLVGEAVGM